jgi:hypothetical protein
MIRLRSDFFASLRAKKEGPACGRLSFYAKVFFYEALAKEPSCKGVLIFAASLLCCLSRSIAGRHSFFVHAKVQRSKAAKGVFSLRFPFFAACPAALRGDNLFFFT